MEQDQEFSEVLRDYAARHAGEKVGKITLAMLRKAMRQLGLPAGNTAEGAKQLAIKTGKAMSEGFTEYHRINYSVNALMESKCPNEAEKLFHKQRVIMSRLCKLQFVHDVLKRIEAKQPVELYWNKKSFAMYSIRIDKDDDGVEIGHGGLVYYPVQALELEVFKHLLPKTQKAAVLPHTPEVMCFSMACKQKPRIVEGKRGGVFEEEVPSGKYYDVIPDKTRPDEVMSYSVGKEMALNSRMFPLLVFLLSLFYEQNRRLIERGKAYRQKTQKEDIKRKFTLKYADIVKRFAFNESKSGQSRAKQMIQRAAGTIINMKVDYRYTENGVPMRRVTNIFDEVESECKNNTWLTASFSEAYAERLVREAKWVMFWGPVLKLRPDHVAPFLVASAKSIPSDGSRWRTSDLQEIARYLGSEEGDKVHDSFHDDVVQKVHDFIRDAEEAGLASFRFMQRKADGTLEKLTDEQARFIEGKEPCGVRHSWNDLDGIVLQAKILDLPDGEKSIEEDEKQILASRKKRRAEKEEAS